MFCSRIFILAMFLLGVVACSTEESSRVGASSQAETENTSEKRWESIEELNALGVPRSTWTDEQLDEYETSYNALVDSVGKDLQSDDVVLTEQDRRILRLGEALTRAKDAKRTFEAASAIPTLPVLVDVPVPNWQDEPQVSALKMSVADFDENFQYQEFTAMSEAELNSFLFNVDIHITQLNELKTHNEEKEHRAQAVLSETPGDSAAQVVADGSNSELLQINVQLDRWKVRVQEAQNEIDSRFN